MKNRYAISQQWCRNRGGGATGPPPQYLSDQLTLFQPGREDYPHPTYYYWHPQCFSPSGITGFQIQASSIYAVIVGTHKKKRGKQKPCKTKLLSSTKGEENRIEL